VTVASHRVARHIRLMLLSVVLDTLLWGYLPRSLPADRCDTSSPPLEYFTSTNAIDEEQRSQRYCWCDSLSLLLACLLILLALSCLEKCLVLVLLALSFLKNVFSLVPLLLALLYPRLPTSHQRDRRRAGESEREQKKRLGDFATRHDLKYDYLFICF
jgi:hypothetical protein